MMGQTISFVAQLLVAAAVGPVEMRPASPWNVEYANSTCVLSRGFGGTVQKPDVTLALRPLPLSTRAEVVVARPLVDKASNKRGSVRITLLPSGAQHQARFAQRRNEPAQLALTSFDIPSEFLASMRDAEAVEIAVASDGAPVRLVTGNASKAFAALTPCQDDLLKTWGYDPAIKDQIATPAEPIGGSFGTYFGRDYYPPEALRLNQEGRATVAWTIAVDGKTRDCRILGSSGVASLDVTTCAVLLQKVRFKPALDRQGKPMPSYQTLAVRWSLED